MSRNIKVIEHSDNYDQYYSFADMDDGFNHYQVKGAKHGERRYQYEDGSLTPEGRVHYGVGPARKKHEGPIAKAKRVYKQNRDEIKKHGFKSWLNGEHDENAQKWKKEYENSFKKDKKSSNSGYEGEDTVKEAEKEIRQKQLDEMNKGSEYIKTTYDPDKNEYTHTIDMSKFLNDTGKIDENKVRDFAQKHPDQLRSMYQEDKKNGIIGSLDSNTQKVLEDKLGDKSSSSSDSNQPEWEKRAKEYGYSSAREYVKENYPYDAQDEDLGEYGHSDQIMKDYGLKTSDFAMDHDGEIVRKDGKYFEVILPNGKKHSYEHLWEIENAYDRGAKPVKSDNGSKSKQTGIDISNKNKKENIGKAKGIKRSSGHFDYGYGESAGVKLKDPKHPSMEEMNEMSRRNSQRVKALKKQGLTLEEIAKKTGVPLGTIHEILY